MTTQQGQYLAALTKYYAGYRSSFLRWAQSTYGQPADVCLANYRRALIAWYEATLRTHDPYRGDADTFVKAMAGYYFNPTPIEPGLAGTAMPFGDDLSLATQERPLHYIPRPLRMNQRQGQMLAGFQQLEARHRELILMAHYHRIDRHRMAEVLGEPGGAQIISERLHKIQLLIRENWEAMRIVDAAHRPSAQDDLLIEKYFTGELETTDRWAVEARLPTDPAFREAVSLREDWAGVLTVAGRQELMELLQREEARLVLGDQTHSLAPARAPNSSRIISGAAPNSSDEVELTPRKSIFSDFELPRPASLLAIILMAVLGYLVWTTFGPAAPERRAVTNFEPFPNIFTEFEPRNEQERDLQRILYYYDRGDYVTTYDELLPVATAYPAAPLYLGVSALALDEPTRALDWFERIPEDDYYRPFADWYTALAYLAAGRTEAGRAELNEILARPGHVYTTRARELLGELQ
ncbi:hypothetical protein [Lewinella sp. 4G2]|uniref:hypothetical protein n=1 Tax=Lewinella sp. 4G2 TaxID=1803372 RepID=UPI0007B4B491|nr:hypothetical protein [Lewinella sp. 4G2]OAV42944.1 hypothetical protein A3850_017125 [Lewinella sp. 4G2]